MIKAVLIITGILGYLAATQWGYRTAQAGVGDVGKLYTQGFAQAATISAANR